MSFTPTETGTFRGKCAELCGEYHSMMLFEVEVVEQAEYDAYIESLRQAGNTGQMQLDDLNPMLDTDAGFPRWSEVAEAENE